MTPVDIAIMTIIREEYEAVCRRLAEQKAIVQKPELDKGVVNEYGWRIASLETKRGGLAYRIVVAMTARPGIEEMSSAVKATMDEFEPRYVVLVGIAGGFHLDGLTKGDVAISDVIYFYEYGKLAKQCIPRHDFVYRVDGALLAAALAWDILDGKWKNLDEDKRPSEHKLTPKALKGVVASGNMLVDDISNDFFAQIHRSWPKLLAVEMEGAGAAASIEHARNKGSVVGFIMIRGISDMPTAELEEGAQPDPQALAQSAQRDQWKKYAAATAANFTVLWIAGGWPLQEAILGESPRPRPRPYIGGSIVGSAIIIVVILVMVFYGRLDGTWESRSAVYPEMNGRFLLKINKDSCSWTERNGSNTLQIHTKIGNKNENLYIERPNNKEVVTFLFRPVLVGEILERSPPPSYLLLQHKGGELVGTWNGLVVETQGTDHVKQIYINEKQCDFVKISDR